MIGLLRRRDFALVWSSGLVSVAGDWMLMAVLPYVVYVRTGSTVATAGMTVAELLPGIVLGSLAGVLADRWDRRRVLVVTNLLQAVTVAGLLLVVHDPRLLPVLYVVAAGQSAIAAFSLPAENALLPTLVPVDQLVAANALNVLNNRIGRLAGLPLGSAVYAAAGLGAVVLLDVASFLAAALLLLGMRSNRRAPSVDAAPAVEPVGPLTAFVAEWRGGLAVLRRQPPVATLFVVFGLMTFGGTMLDPLSAAWVRDELGEGATVYAMLMTTHALAGIGGALLVGSLGARLPARLLAGAASLVAGGLLLVRFNVPVVSVALALSAVSGVTAVASSVGVEALAQQRIPQEFSGRVFGSLQATVWLLSLLGAAVGGVGAEVIGLVPTLDVASVLVGLSGAVMLLALPARDPRMCRPGEIDGPVEWSQGDSNP